jgi:alpha-amylase/alpha-mannosidase (GH57 family)
VSRVALLWHLHQPDYRDAETRRPAMPWVRLHALRGYRDMVVEALEREPAWTINVVPVLLEQLDEVAAGMSDDHLDLTRRAADALSAEDIARMRASFVGGHPDLVGAWPRWRELSARLTAGERLSEAELRDVQVWSTLAWFGATAHRDLPAVAALREKGRDFDDADKAAMLAAADEVVRALPGQLQRLAGTRTALSVSPYYHPILPLLVDVQHARRSDPSLPADLSFAYPQDATLQVRRAVEDFTRRFGRPPKGLWPSEGSVSPEVAEIVAAEGLRWLVSDVGVLRRSDGEGAGLGPWRLADGLVGFFRDTALSDRIGFEHRFQAPEAAVADLMGEAARRDGLVVLALDGENPWEGWPGAGGAYRRHLMDALEGGPSRGITLDDAAELPPCGVVRRLHTGSWIGADLAVWCGHPDDHAAWRLLGKTRAAVERSPRRDEALERLLPAEGSDWAWWLGPEFTTPYASVFHGLLRSHLLATWQALGEPPPPELDALLHAGHTARVEEPSGLVDPEADAGAAAWAGAGRWGWSVGGSMASAPPFADAAFGWDRAGRLWVRAPWREPPVESERLEVEVDGATTELAHGEAADGTGWAVWARPDALVVRVDAGRARLVVTRVESGHRRRAPDVGALELAAPEVAPALRWWSV